MLDHGLYLSLHQLKIEKSWLYAQFVVSKTVDLKKSHVGLTIIRDSSIDHKSFTERAGDLGGLVEFYRSNNRNIWSPTGVLTFRIIRN